jgi:voltage-gated sodium channel
MGAEKHPFLVMSNFKSTFLKIRENNLFEIFVISVIIISAIAVGFRTYEETFNPEIYLYLSYLDYFITTVFLVEIIIRMLAEKRALDFFNEPWNVFDFIIVFISLIPIESLNSILLARLVRVFRLLRLVSFIPQFRVLIESFITAIPRVSYILLFMFVEFYIFAAIGSILFSEISPLHWGNVGLAMLTLFQTATLEGWPDLMYQSLEVQRYSWIFFVVFIILNSLVFMNMIIGVIIDVIVKANDEESPENIRLLNEINSRIESLEKKLNKNFNND